jgi:hypothetical protein
MNKLTISFAIAAFALSPVLAGYANAQEGAASAAGPGQTQTFTGVLLDANCSGVKNMAASRMGTAGSAETAGGIQDSSGVARAGAPGPGGAVANPEAGVGPATAGQQDRARDEKGAGRPGDERRSGKPSDETATGASASAGDRFKGMMLPAELRACVANSNTTAYALYSNGRIIHLEAESTGKVRGLLKSESQSADRTRGGAAAEPVEVQVHGQLQLKVTSVQPGGSGRNR